MHISLIGKSKVGKTTLFQALTGMEFRLSQIPHVSVIDVPDERLEHLSSFFKVRKTVHARIEIEDTPSLHEGIFQKIRQTEAFILVLPFFEGKDTDLTHEYKSIVNEFILSDMAQIEQRLIRIAKQGGKRENPLLQQEKDILDICLSHLNEEKPLSNLTLPEDKSKLIRGFQFLSAKPMMVVINCSEDMLEGAGSIEASFREKLGDSSIPCIAVCASLEAEIGKMNEEEKQDFLSGYSIKESVKGRIIRLATETLGLITFFTIGDDECRAWHLKKGETVHEAARLIHTDFYNKFIRAEVVAYEDFIKYNGFAGCKKAGVWRLEGKTYIVKDGDIITIRAGA